MFRSNRILTGALGQKLYVLVGVNVVTVKIRYVGIDASRDDDDEANRRGHSRRGGDLRWDITRRDVGRPGYAYAGTL